MNKNKTILFRIASLLLAITLFCPVKANAVESRASSYLETYSAYACAVGWYKVQFWVSVTGVADMDEIGATSIRLYESTDNETWTLIKTFSNTDYPDILGYNDCSHSGHVEYQGTIGHYYKAYVCVWTEKDGTGDARYIWTNSVKATLFAE